MGSGCVAAPSTAAEHPGGFCFAGVTLTAADGVAPGSVRLARPWHPGGRPESVGSAQFVGCTIGPHVAADRWADMGGHSWSDGGRFGESGSVLAPGAVPAAPAHRRPATAEAATHLAGWDGPPAASGRVHVLSDSTASDYPPERAPRTGWGQVFGEVTGREVRNHAVSGMSTTSLIASGTLGRALATVTPGDLVLIAFGHNDAKDDERHADPYRAYPAHLRRVVGGVRARGGLPVLLTPVERRTFVDGRARSTHGPYPQAVRRVAAEEGVPLVDLTVASRALWQEQGEDGSRASFLWLEPGRWPGHPAGERDDTHLSREGALVVARLVAAGLRAAGVTP
ncbi:rhamnogalacturonan acetylesterase [Propioniciclava coleopterorum]|uniref:Rhamnogalacturonan acetylesterase n=1 Tax=Propioniciclava coleopterorum TaxID=2714937 RepID=A0A6G7Y998_9ACTN|nr:rhamnogalacturonan acetylesterase [Propioniciclava coleopterorum]QIK73187.1 rhamnogalacturonan acetylesterase [Propioniciclava coleopterorum]